MRELNLDNSIKNNMSVPSFTDKKGILEIPRFTEKERLQISESDIVKELATGGLRFNEGKTRLGLISPTFLEEIGKVLTYGANKYTVKDDTGKILVTGDNNWKRGMNWSKCTDSLERHLNSFKAGVDYDDESGCLHLAHVAVNAMFLMEYYNIHPENDDRQQWWKVDKRPKIYLDIDGVLADFNTAFINWFDFEDKEPAYDWDDSRFRDNFDYIKNNEEFWFSIPPLVTVKDIPFLFDGYCTDRPIDDKITQLWLDVNKFPRKELININGTGVTKGEVLKGKCDIFVDDSINNFIDINKHGISCYLMTRSHNERFDVGYRRINHLNELKYH